MRGVAEARRRGPSGTARARRPAVACPCGGDQLAAVWRLLSTGKARQPALASTGMADRGARGGERVAAAREGAWAGAEE